MKNCIIWKSICLATVVILVCVCCMACGKNDDKNDEGIVNDITDYGKDVKDSAETFAKDLKDEVETVTKKIKDGVEKITEPSTNK